MKKIIEMKPPRIALGLFLVSWCLAAFSPPETVLHFPYRLLGPVFLLGGFGIMMLAWYQFKKAATAICPKAEASVIVTKGAFRFTRNPMYLGMLLMLVGGAFLVGSLPAFLAPVVFFAAVDRVFIPYEESKLTEGFGPQYMDYMNSTRRWI